MTRRQIAYGLICLLVGILIGMEIAGMLDVLIRILLIVVIVFLLIYLILPYLPRGVAPRRLPGQRMQQRRTRRKP
jgi:hypothetical protein